MAAHIIYIDRAGSPMTKEAWVAKKADPSYATVSEYDNGVVHLQLVWVGRIVNPQDTYKEYWKAFVLLVQNYKSDGSLVNDPVAGDMTYPTEAAAAEAYQAFLLRWTNCEADDEGVFVEADNDLTPPPPPDPNRPATVSEELGDAGAW